MTPDSKAKIDNNVVPKVAKFKFLCNMVPDCSSYVQHQISLASQAFGRLRTIWSSKDVSIKIKILYGELILPLPLSHTVQSHGLYDERKSMRF